MTVGWGADILGDGFMQLSLPLGEDSEGAVVATLVRAVPERGPASWFAARPLGDVDVADDLKGWEWLEPSGGDV